MQFQWCDTILEITKTSLLSCETQTYYVVNKLRNLVRKLLNVSDAELFGRSDLFFHFK